MELCVPREAISKGSSSSDDSLEPAVQCREEWWMSNWQSAASHDVHDTTQPVYPDALRHVHSKALEDSSSNFDTTITSNSLANFWEASPAALANDTTPYESEDFDTWLKALGASPNIEDGLMEPESSEIPLLPVGDIKATFTGNSIGEDHYHTETAIGKPLPSLYLLANNIPDVTKADSPSAPKPIPATPGFDHSERSNGFGTRHQLNRKLASAAKALVMRRQGRATNKKHSLVPATEQKKKPQRSHPLEKEKIKKVRRLETCAVCTEWTETVSFMLDLFFIVDWCPSMTISPTSCAGAVNSSDNEVPLRLEDKFNTLNVTRLCKPWKRAANPTRIHMVI